MQHPALAQQVFSSERVPTVSRIFPTIEFLLSSLEAAQREKAFAPIRGAITAGISNLTKWYQKLDGCHVYAVSNGMSNETRPLQAQLTDQLDSHRSVLQTIVYQEKLGPRFCPAYLDDPCNNRQCLSF